MEGEWFPQPDQLMESVRMLQALRDPTRPDHPHAVASLDQHVANPAFAMVMMHVFVSGARYQQQGLSNDLRQLAGLVIKNYVFPHLTRQTPDVQSQLKRDVVRVLQDDVADIRKTGAILAGKISESFPVGTWSDMMPPILQMLDPAVQTTHATALEGALQATQRICEDSALKLALDDANRPLDVLIPRLLALTASSEPSIRLNALSSYNSLLYLLHPQQHGQGSSSGGSASRSRADSLSDAQEGAASSSSGGGGMLRGTSKEGAGLSSQALGNAAHPLIMHMNAFIARLAALSADPHSAVRTAVCQAITTISCSHVAVLEPYFADICRFMLAALQDTEECVAIESCEFWAVMIESEDTKGAIAPYLHTLVEHLISRLHLTAEQMEQERIDEEEENSGEKELNLRPMHHRPSSGHGGSGSSADDERDTAEVSSRWTLRKQAALLLDTVAQACPPSVVLSAALPRIQACFQDPSLLVRERGVLALGALSTGCLEDMAQYVPQLFPFLLQNIQASLPEMRSISCWVLSRYCSLFPSLGAPPGQSEQQGPSAEGQACYVQTLHALLAAMFDATTKVQVAACSALGILVEQSFYVATSDSSSGEDSQNILVPHLPAVLTSISRAFDVYGVKSSLILIDTIGTIADNVGAELKAPQYTALYLAKLMHRFDALEDFDMRMFPVLECLTSLLPVIGLEAQQYVLSVYSRCLRIASAVFAAHHQHQQLHQGGGGSVHSGSGGDSAKSGASTTASEEEHDLPSKDFAICALDVVSALCEGLDDMFSTLVRDAGSHTPETLFQLMFAALGDPLPELRQCGFSLAGEISKHSFALLSPALAGQLLQACVECIHPDYPLVCNNAAWAAGELALRVGSDFLHPFVAQLMNRLITVLQSAHLQDAIRTNVAVTVGRLAVVDTLEVPALADEYFADWCSVLELPCPTAERIQAYQGMLSILHQNPNLVLGNKTHIYSLLAALAAWQAQGESPPPEQLQGFREVLLAVRSHNPSLWNRVVAKFGLHYDYHALAAEFQLQA